MRNIPYLQPNTATTTQPYLKRVLWVVALGLAAFTQPCQAQLKPNTDSVDVLRYHIALDVPDPAVAVLKGTTAIHFKATKANLKAIDLELLNLELKAVEVQGRKVDAVRDGFRIKVPLPAAMANGDTTTVTVSYGGKPAAPSRFGGFYFSDTIAYNLGVSINDIPHNFGKAWFVCRDNFTDKAKFRYSIRTSPRFSAICSGDFDGVTTEPDGLQRWDWFTEQPIPTYLASVAVGEYVPYRENYTSTHGNKMIEIWTPRAQAQHVKASFARLKTCLAHYESLFGPYRWGRVGYVAVPMTGGAMEHAMNIAYPRNFIDGTTQHDLLWAHELSHAWFGNLVTCAGSWDMWLNEGFARYAEALFIEKTEGRQAFLDKIHEILTQVMKRGVESDNGVDFPLSAVPDKHTYGYTVYDKGALVAHSLRGYMGDTLFFAALKAWFDLKAYGTADSREFADFLTNFSQLDVNAFFDGWVHSGGFPHFALTKMETEPAGDATVAKLTITQRQLNRSTWVKKHRLPLRFLAENGRSVDTVITLTDEQSEKATLSVKLPFRPLAVVLDPNNNYCDAKMAQYRTLTATGKATLGTIGAAIDVKAVNKQAALLVVRAMLPPTDVPTGVKAAAGYWEVSGLLPDDFRAELTFNEAPFKPQAATLKLYYRKDASSAWQPVTSTPPTSATEHTVPAQTGQYAFFAQ